LPNVHTEVNIF